MKKMVAAWFAVFLAFASTVTVLAHHSLANFDTTTAVRVKGTIFQFQSINPHTYIFLDQKTADGATRRWAVEGPSLIQLSRKGVAKDVLKPGDVVEVCGYVPKEATVWQIASTDPSAASPAGRLINAETLVMPDGREQSWGDYGVHKCFAPGFEDQHSKR
jgi:DNA/RNA endonuclease YhcR with UshA esterase domain